MKVKSSQRGSKVISARVDLNTLKILDNICKSTGKPRNKVISELVTGITKSPSTSAIDTSESMDEGLRNVLSALGGAGIGLLTYKGIYNVLDQERYSTEERERYSFIGAVAVGVMSSIGVNELLKKIG